MPELDAERRERLAEVFRGSTRNPEHLAFLVEPLIAGWLADAWDAARNAGHSIACRFDGDPDECICLNPYRAGEPT